MIEIKNATYYFLAFVNNTDIENIQKNYAETPFGLRDVVQEATGKKLRGAFKHFVNRRSFEVNELSNFIRLSLLEASGEMLGSRKDAYEINLELGKVLAYSTIVIKTISELAESPVLLENDIDISEYRNEASRLLKKLTTLVEKRNPAEGSL